VIVLSSLLTTFSLLTRRSEDITRSRYSDAWRATSVARAARLESASFWKMCRKWVLTV
jgi:hypothetical protein